MRPTWGGLPSTPRLAGDRPLSVPLSRKVARRLAAVSEADTSGPRCGSCGTVAPVGARFCASCGAALTARADERRVVTVLFADIVGFTALAERTDPEQVKNLVDRCFERLASDIADHGGRVDKILGD